LATARDPAITDLCGLAVWRKANDQSGQVTPRQPSCHCPLMGSDDDVAPPSTERLVDGVVQSVNVVLAMAGCVALGVLAGAHFDPQRSIALAVYAAGLLAMVGCSALYAWGRGGSRHSLYRHLDQAAIFVMIAGTYTPFIAMSLGSSHGLRLLAVVWAMALAGLLFKLIAPRRFEPLSVPLYLITGWAVLCDPQLLLNLPARVSMLLVAGGGFYTVGIAFHRARMRFQEAIWHSFVLAAAACHYAAVVCVAA
jgi:hemolysin III